MDRFLKMNGTLVNIDRVLAVHHRPELLDGILYNTEHYQVVFDTGQELRLSPEDGKLLIDHGIFRSGSPPDGTTITTSERAT
jgi:hypothetical protein